MACNNARWIVTGLALGSLLIAAAACHQVKITTGLDPGATVHHEEWNMAYAYAIFPAQVDASQYCGGRWARVETRQSFLNWVVGALTFGIISPMETKVICSATGTRDGAAAGGSPQQGPDQPRTATFRHDHMEGI
jgi:hypothetical protein